MRVSFPTDAEDDTGGELSAAQMTCRLSGTDYDLSVDEVLHILCCQSPIPDPFHVLSAWVHPSLLGSAAPGHR